MSNHSLAEDTTVNLSNSLARVLDILQKMEPEDRVRIIETISTFYREDLGRTGPSRDYPAAGNVSVPPPPVPFSSESTPSPKDFLLEKQPRTDVERIACLAYYLEHYRDMEQFKTLDLSKLNTEAAQPKFANASESANNAVKAKYLVPTSKGYRKLSAVAERFVGALPDRESAKSAMSLVRPRRRTKPKKVVLNVSTGD